MCKSSFWAAIFVLVAIGCALAQQSEPVRVEGAVQGPTALLGITLAFSLVPCFIALLRGGAILVYPLNQRRVNEIERELDARRAAGVH